MKPGKRAIDLEKFRFSQSQGRPKRLRNRNGLSIYRAEYYQRWLANLKSPDAIKFRDLLLSRTALNASGTGMRVKKMWNKGKRMNWAVKEKQKFPEQIIIYPHDNLYRLEGIDAILAMEFCKVEHSRSWNNHVSAQVSTNNFQEICNSFTEAGLTCRVYGKDRKILAVVSPSSPLFYPGISTLFEASTEEEEAMAITASGRPEAYEICGGTCLLLFNGSERTYTCFSAIGRQTKDRILGMARPVHIQRFPRKSVNQMLAELRATYDLDETELYKVTWNKNRRYINRSTTDLLGIGSPLPYVPDVIRSMMGKGVTRIERMFMERWLSVPPSESGRVQMQNLLEWIFTSTSISASSDVLNPYKTMGLLTSGGRCKDMTIVRRLYNAVSSRIESEESFHVAFEFIMGSSSCSEDYKLYMVDLSDIERKLKKLTVSNPTKNTEKTDTSRFRNKYETWMVEEELSRVKLEKAWEKIEEYFNKRSYIGKPYFHRKSRLLLSQHAVSVKSEWTCSRCSWPNERKEDKCLMCDLRQEKEIVNALSPQGNGLFTDFTLEKLTTEYIKAAEQHKKAQDSVIRAFARDTSKNLKLLNTLRVFLWSQVVLKSAKRHLDHTTCRGWSRPEVVSAKETMEIEGVFPHWMSQRESVSNDFTIANKETCLMTAQNGFGKTTLIRTVMVSALLANCGLWVPAKSARIPRVSGVFLRLPGTDKPGHSRSSWNSEVSDIKVILEQANENSLVFLDEISSTTSHLEGAEASHVFIEYLQDVVGCRLVFSTHIHRMLDDFEECNTPSRTIKHFTLDENFNFHRGSTRDSGAIDVMIKLGLPRAAVLSLAERLFTSGHVFSESTQKKLSCIRKQEKNTLVVPHEQQRDRIVELAKKITKSEHMVFVPEGYQIPPSVNSYRCQVYIYDEGPLKGFYVGESRNVQRRSQEHWRDSRRAGDLFIFGVDNKSDSLTFETLIERAAMAEKILLTSTEDSHHLVI